MTLRILEEFAEHEQTVALHGWLSIAEVSELERVVGAHEGSMKLDLANLAGVDAAGLRALLRLRDEGVRLVGASPFVALLLERAAKEVAAHRAASNGGST